MLGPLLVQGQRRLQAIQPRQLCGTRSEILMVRLTNTTLTFASQPVSEKTMSNRDDRMVQVGGVEGGGGLR